MWFTINYCILILIFLINNLKYLTAHEESLSKVLLISFDGFRWDYLDIASKNNLSTPNFNKLKHSGVSLKDDGVHNIFITKTFPNHYSIVTGLYEESHGIVANDFYDPVYNQIFDIHNGTIASEIKWWNGTRGIAVYPIWKINEKYSTIKSPRHSGVYSWPGINVKEYQSTYFETYTKNSSFEKAIDTIVNWFSDENKAINFGAIYFDEPDTTGHKFGPNSRELFDKIKYIDKLIGYLLDKLEEYKILHSMNIIITSDHGMAEMVEEVILEDIIDTNLFKVFSTSPLFHILPNDGMESLVFNSFVKSDKLIVYNKSNIPRHFHYSENRRITPIILTAKEGVYICIKKQNCSMLKGDHGYSNDLKSMQPIFLASGPAFKKNYSSRTFNLTDIYPLICYILDITPQNNNGSFDNIKHILNGFTDDEGSMFLFDSTNLTYFLAISFTVLVALMFVIGSINSYIHLKYCGYSSALQFDGNKRPLISNSLHEEEEEEEELIVLPSSF